MTPAGYIVPGLFAAQILVVAMWLVLTRRKDRAVERACGWRKGQAWEQARARRRRARRAIGVKAGLSSRR